MSRDVAGTVAVVGAGIGGLTAALALRQAGVDAVVVERQPAVRPAGAGIMLWGDTMDALDALGVGRDIAANAGVVDRSELRDPQGQPVEGLWMGSFVEKDRAARPPVCIHRTLLHDILLQAVGKDCVQLGVGLERFSVHGGAVEVGLAGGGELRAEVLVGADGIHSAVRAQLFPAAPPAYDGQTIFRGVAGPMPEVTDRAAFVAIGEGCRFGWAPMHDGTVYWFGGRFQAEGRPDHLGGPRADLLASFGHWAAPVPQLIEGTEEGQILRNDVYVVGPLDAWGSGPVTLLGDAAHAIAPHIGQGACLAIDDARTLAEELRGGPSPEALRRYEARRQQATQPLFDMAGRLRSALESGSLIAGAATANRAGVERGE